MRISDWSSDVCSSDLIDRRQAKRVPRLQLNVDDHAFFDELIGRAPVQMEPARESHRRLADAKSYIDGFITRLVANYDKQSQVGVLNDWISFLELQASLILLKAPDRAHAFRVFVTSKGRGHTTFQELGRASCGERTGPEDIDTVVAGS